MWLAATREGETRPETVTYQKNAASGFYEILGYNRKADDEAA